MSEATRWWNGKRVLITGGTSGLGEALTRSLVGLGARVAIVARSQPGIDRVVSECQDVVGIRADVSRADDARRVVAEAIGSLGHVDVLVNNASYLGRTPLRYLVDTDGDDLDRVLQTNVSGPFRLTKALVPDMLLRKAGLVINVSSDAGAEAYPTWGAYGTSKAALNHMSRVFAEELKGSGVRFLCVDPGDMNTPMHFEAIPDADPSALLDPAVAAMKLIELGAEAGQGNEAA